MEGLTLEQEMAIDEKIGAMNAEEMQERIDELDAKEELNDSEEYEYGELEDRLDSLNPEVDDEVADKDD